MPIDETPPNDGNDANNLTADTTTDPNVSIPNTSSTTTIVDDTNSTTQNNLLSQDNVAQMFIKAAAMLQELHDLINTLSNSLSNKCTNLCTQIEDLKKELGLSQQQLEVSNNIPTVLEDLINQTKIFATTTTTSNDPNDNKTIPLSAFERHRNANNDARYANNTSVNSSDHLRNNRTSLMRRFI